MATTILLFTTGSIPRVNNESLTTPDFAGNLLSYKRDAPLEMPPQNQDRPVNNMNMEDQNMMSKYSQPALTSWLKKRFLRAAFLTLVMVSMTASPVCVMPSLAQEPRSTDQMQQTLNGELQSSGNPQDAPETVEVVKGGIAAATFAFANTSFTFVARPGNNIIDISLPLGTRAVSVWITEGVGGRSHIGNAVFSTSSVQLSQDGSKARVRYNLAYTRNLNAIAMVIFG